MIAGIEGIHAWTPPGAGAAAVELGRIIDNAGTKIWPHFTIDRLTGLMSTGEAEDNRDRPPGRGIEIPRRSVRRGKTVVYEGRIRARSLLQLREAEAALRAAFDDNSAEGRMDVDWHVLFTAASAIPAKFYEARALPCEIEDVQGGEKYERSYVVGLRMGDRRYWDAAAKTSSLATAETRTPVSTVVAFPAIADGPVLTLELPASTEEARVTVRNVTSGKSLSLLLPAAWPSTVLTLDFGSRKILDEKAADRSSLLDPSDVSLWSPGAPLVAGNNEMRIEVVKTASVVKSPGTVANDASGGTTAWTNPTNAKASDNAYATVTAVESQYLKATNYGFAIASTALVVGRVMEVEIKGNEAFSVEPHFVKAGTIEASLGVAGNGGSAEDQVKTYGTPTNLEGLGFVPADVNNSGFGAAIKAGRFVAGTPAVSVDTMAMRVFYKPIVAYAAKATLTWNEGHY
jgi:hypothetical protein